MTIRSDEPLSAGSGPGPVGGRGRADEAGAADAVAGPSASGGAGAAVSSGGAPDSRAADGPRANGPGRGVSGPSGGAPSRGVHAFLSEERPDSDFPGDATGSGLEADGASVDDLPAEGPVDDLPVNGPANSASAGHQSADGPANSASAGHQSADGPADDLPVDDPVDDLPAVADGEGMSPVVREYVERLRSEALARDAELRARGIDPYKGTPVDEEPRRRLGARALAVLAVLVVAVVSVGAYVVFFRGEPDYGMSHGYQVQSDGSLKRPPITDKAPDKPAEMTKGDEAGAEATARYYLNLGSYAWNTGDTGPLKSISDADCVYCRSEYTHIDEFYAHGYWATKGYTDVLQTQAIEKLPESEHGPDAYAVQFRIDEHVAEGYTSNGFQQAEVYSTIVQLHVRWDGTAWHIMEGAAKDAKGNA